MTEGTEERKGGDFDERFTFVLTSDIIIEVKE
jgi:hypothetical protein